MNETALPGPGLRGGDLHLGILKESAAGETRVALLPESLKDSRHRDIDGQVESGAGVAAGAHERRTSRGGRDGDGRPRLILRTRIFCRW